MNSKKKSRTLLHGNTSSQDVSTTPKSESAKHNLLTSCRRVGLKRNRNKSLGVSPIPNVQSKHIFVEEDLKQINELKLLTNIAPHTDSHEVQTSFTSELTTLSKISKEDTVAKIRVKKKFTYQRKRKIDSDEDRTATVNDLSESSSLTDSPTLAVKKLKETVNLDKLDNKSVKQTNPTLPVSINLTRCDLNALKIKYPPEKNKIENIQENKENLLTIPNKKTDDKNTALGYNKENAEELIIEPEANIDNIEESNVEQLEKTSILEESNVEQLEKTSILEESNVEQLEKTPILKPNNNIPTENNSLEDNSDGSDFFQDVIRRKKKKILKNKQRNISKPSSSQQKTTPTTNKRISANNTPCYSDSDDDFVATPTRRDRKSSVKSKSSSQNLTDDEKVKSPKKKLKMKKPVVDELNKTGHIRISENKSYTIIHRHNTVSYVKSYDNDVNFKVTESDDNQQLPVRNSVELPNKSKILERKDYITKRHNSSSDNAQILMEMPSIFTDLMNKLDSAATDLENTPPEEKENKITENEMPKNKEKIPSVSTYGSKKNKTSCSIKKTKEIQINNTETTVIETANSQNVIEPIEPNKSDNKIIEPDKKDNKIIEPDKNDNKIIEPNKSDYKSTAQKENNSDSSDSDDSSSDSPESGTTTGSDSKNGETSGNGSKNSQTSENVSKNSETKNGETSGNGSKNIQTSENGSKNSETSKPSLEVDDDLKDLNKKELMEILTTLRANVKKKQERLESLQRISVYKETHNLEELRGVTLQIKRGCQNALVDLVLSLKQKSKESFTMATLLEYMKIPNELVGYSLEEDKFI